MNSDADDFSGSFPMPGQESKKRNLFGLFRSTGPKNNEDALRYKSKTQAVPQSKKKEKPAAKRSFIEACPVWLFKLVNGANQNQGAVGCAIVPTKQAGTFIVHIYQPKTMAQVCLGVISPTFNIIVQKDHYISFYDNKQQYWTIRAQAQAPQNTEKMLHAITMARLQNPAADFKLINQPLNPVDPAAQKLARGDQVKARYTLWNLSANHPWDKGDVVVKDRDVRLRLGSGKDITGIETALEGMVKGQRSICVIPGSLVQATVQVDFKFPAGRPVIALITVRDIKKASEEANQAATTAPAQQPAAQPVPAAAQPAAAVAQPEPAAIQASIQTKPPLAAQSSNEDTQPQRSRRKLSVGERMAKLARAHGPGVGMQMLTAKPVAVAPSQPSPEPAEGSGASAPGQASQGLPVGASYGHQPPVAAQPAPDASRPRAGTDPAQHVTLGGPGGRTAQHYSTHPQLPHTNYASQPSPNLTANSLHQATTNANSLQQATSAQRPGPGMGPDDLHSFAGSAYTGHESHPYPAEGRPGLEDDVRSQYSYRGDHPADPYPDNWSTGYPDRGPFGPGRGDPRYRYGPPGGGYRRNPPRDYGRHPPPSGGGGFEEAKETGANVREVKDKLDGILKAKFDDKFDMEGMIKMLHSLVSERNKFKSAQEESEETIKKLRTDLDTVRSKQLAVLEKNTNLMEKAASMDKDKQSAVDDVLQKHRALEAEHEAKTKQLAEQVETLTKAKEELEAKATALQASNASLEQKLSGLESSAKESAAGLSAQSAELEAKVKALEASKTELTAKGEKAAARVKELEASVDALKNAASATGGAKEEATKALAQATQRGDLLEQELRDLKEKHAGALEQAEKATEDARAKLKAFKQTTKTSFAEKVDAQCKQERVEMAKRVFDFVFLKMSDQLGNEKFFKPVKKTLKTVGKQVLSDPEGFDKES